jgi:putative membrane protein
MRGLRKRAPHTVANPYDAAANTLRRQMMMVNSFCRATAIAVGSAALIAAGCSFLQTSAEVTPVDQQFMLTAASVGTAEVDMAELAERHAGDPAVKAYGRRLAQDHTRINDELSRLADRKHVNLIDAMDPANRTLYEELANLSGKLFDREYLLAQINIHRMGNGLYESEAQAGEDADVKAFAGKNVPVGVEHLQLARKLLAKEQPAGG